MIGDLFWLIVTIVGLWHVCLWLLGFVIVGVSWLFVGIVYLFDPVPRR